MKTAIARSANCSTVFPGQGETLRIFDEEFVVQVTGEDSSGAYAVATGSVAPGGGPPLHAHPGNETFYVLTGEFEFTQRDERGVTSLRGGPGTVFHAPAGAPHRFENVSSTRSTMVVIAAAEAIDFLRELAAAFPPGSESDLEKMLTIHAKYNVETIHGGAGSRPEPPRGGATSARARALAWRIEQASASLVAFLESCGPDQWRALCADTGWTVGVQAHHIAAGEAAILRSIQDVAEGRPHPPMTIETLDAINARHAIEFANVTKDEALALLGENVSMAARQYRLLTDEQLERSATLLVGHPPATVADLIEYLAIGEIERHGAFIESAIGS